MKLVTVDVEYVTAEGGMGRYSMDILYWPEARDVFGLHKHKRYVLLKITMVWRIKVW